MQEGLTGREGNLQLVLSEPVLGLRDIKQFSNRDAFGILKITSLIKKGKIDEDIPVRVFQLVSDIQTKLTQYKSGNPDSNTSRLEQQIADFYSFIGVSDNQALRDKICALERGKETIEAVDQLIHTSDSGIGSKPKPIYALLSATSLREKDGEGIPEEDFQAGLEELYEYEPTHSMIRLMVNACESASAETLSSMRVQLNNWFTRLGTQYKGIIAENGEVNPRQFRSLASHAYEYGLLLERSEDKTPIDSLPHLNIAKHDQEEIDQLVQAAQDELFERSVKTPDPSASKQLEATYGKDATMLFRNIDTIHIVDDRKQDVVQGNSRAMRGIAESLTRIKPQLNPLYETFIKTKPESGHDYWRPTLTVSTQYGTISLFEVANLAVDEIKGVKSTISPEHYKGLYYPELHRALTLLGQIDGEIKGIQTEFIQQEKQGTHIIDAITKLKEKNPATHQKLIDYFRVLNYVYLPDAVNGAYDFWNTVTQGESDNIEIESNLPRGLVAAGYDIQRQVRPISMGVDPEAITLISAPNGAGKTVRLRELCDAMNRNLPAYTTHDGKVDIPSDVMMAADVARSPEWVIDTKGNRIIPSHMRGVCDGIVSRLAYPAVISDEVIGIDAINSLALEVANMLVHGKGVFVTQNTEPAYRLLAALGKKVNVIGLDQYDDLPNTIISTGGKQLIHHLQPPRDFYERTGAPREFDKSGREPMFMTRRDLDDLQLDNIIMLSLKYFPCIIPTQETRTQKNIRGKMYEGLFDHFLKSRKSKQEFDLLWSGLDQLSSSVQQTGVDDLFSTLQSSKKRSDLIRFDESLQAGLSTIVEKRSPMARIEGYYDNLKRFSLLNSTLNVATGEFSWQDIVNVGVTTDKDIESIRNLIKDYRSLFPIEINDIRDIVRNSRAILDTHVSIDMIMRDQQRIAFEKARASLLDSLKLTEQENVLIEADNERQQKIVMRKLQVAQGQEEVNKIVSTLLTTDRGGFTNDHMQALDRMFRYDPWRPGKMSGVEILNFKDAVNTLITYWQQGNEFLQSVNTRNGTGFKNYIERKLSDLVYEKNRTPQQDTLLEGLSAIYALTCIGDSIGPARAEDIIKSIESGTIPRVVLDELKLNVGIKKIEELPKGWFPIFKNLYKEFYVPFMKREMLPEFQEILAEKRPERMEIERKRIADVAKARKREEIYIAVSNISFDKDGIKTLQQILNEHKSDGMLNVDVVRKTQFDIDEVDRSKQKYTTFLQKNGFTDRVTIKDVAQKFSTLTLSNNDEKTVEQLFRSQVESVVKDRYKRLLHAKGERIQECRQAVKSLFINLSLSVFFHRLGASEAINNPNQLSLENATPLHVLVERLQANGKWDRFQLNDEDIEDVLTHGVTPINVQINLDQEAQMVAGENATGKSVMLNTIALYQLLGKFRRFLPGKVSLGNFDGVVSVSYGKTQQRASAYTAGSNDYVNALWRMHEGGKLLVLADEIGEGTDFHSKVVSTLQFIQYAVDRGCFPVFVSLEKEVAEALQRAGAQFSILTYQQKYTPTSTTSFTPPHSGIILNEVRTGPNGQDLCPQSFIQLTERLSNYISQTHLFSPN